MPNSVESAPRIGNSIKNVSGVSYSLSLDGGTRRLTFSSTNYTELSKSRLRSVLDNDLRRASANMKRRRILFERSANLREYLTEVRLRAALRKLHMQLVPSTVSLPSCSSTLNVRKLPVPPQFKRMPITRKGGLGFFISGAKTNRVQCPPRISAMLGHTPRRFPLGDLRRHEAQQKRDVQRAIKLKEIRSHLGKVSSRHQAWILRRNSGDDNVQNDQHEPLRNFTWNDVGTPAKCGTDAVKARLTEPKRSKKNAHHHPPPVGQSPHVHERRLLRTRRIRSVERKTLGGISWHIPVDGPHRCNGFSRTVPDRLIMEPFRALTRSEIQMNQMAAETQRLSIMSERLLQSHARRLTNAAAASERRIRLEVISDAKNELAANRVKACNVRAHIENAERGSRGAKVVAHAKYRMMHTRLETCLQHALASGYQMAAEAGRQMNHNEIRNKQVDRIEAAMTSWSEKISRQRTRDMQRTMMMTMWLNLKHERAARARQDALEARVTFARGVGLRTAMARKRIAANNAHQKEPPQDIFGSKTKLYLGNVSSSAGLGHIE